MNEIVQYVALSGVVLVLFGLVFAFAGDEIENSIISQHDKTEIEKKQTSEQITLIEMIQNPLQIDVMNVGLDSILIKKLYIHGVADPSFTISDIYGNTLTTLPADELVTITPSVPGTSVKIITENNKIFSFE